MPIKLTDATVKNLPVGEYWDSLLPAFGVRIGKRRRTWLVRYRQGGRNPRLTIGHFPPMALSEARQAARQAFERLDSGARPEPSPPPPRSDGALTVMQIIDRYELMRREEGKRIKTLGKHLHMVRREIDLAGLASLPARRFSKHDVRQVRDTIAGRGSLQQSGCFVRALSPVWSWAASEDLVEHNVCTSVRVVPRNSRSRVLSRDEIAVLWHATDRLSGASSIAFGRLLRFLFLTGLRRSEGANLRYGDILDGTLRLRDTKGGRPHSLKLPQLALDILGTGDARSLCFARRDGNPITNFTAYMLRMAKLAKLEPWVLHDARRSIISHLQSLGTPNHVLSALLNHSPAGILAIYARGELEDQKAAALQRWADEIQRIIAKPRLALA